MMLQFQLSANSTPRSDAPIGSVNDRLAADVDAGTQVADGEEVGDISPTAGSTGSVRTAMFRSIQAAGDNVAARRAEVVAEHQIVVAVGQGWR